MSVSDRAEINQPLNLIRRSRMVAIIRLDDLSTAVELSTALLAGGVVAQEFTLTNPDALHAVEQVLRNVEAFATGQATLGVGSIRGREDAEAAVAAGAHFLVTPTLNLPACEIANLYQVPMLCGAYTPTEILTAWQSGAAMVKVFPARGLGPSYIKDVLAPLPDLQLMPTGGVDQATIAEYLNAGATAVGVGGSLVDAQAVQNRDWSKVTSTARQFVQCCQ